MSHAVGVDVGTTNTKAVLVDEEGRVLAAASRALTTTTDGATATQDAEAVWAAVLDAVAEVAAAEPSAAAEVAALGVCSQYSSTVPVAPDGTPTGPMVLYLDQRGAEHCWSIMERHPDAFEVWLEHHGIPPVGAGLSLAHVLHLQLDRPELHGITTAYLEVMDYVNARLTGRVAATQGTMFTSQLCDNRTVGGTEYDPALLERSGVDPTRLPTLVDLEGVHGHLRVDVAERLGLPAGIEVRTGMNDSQAGALATGAFVPGRTGVMIGTTAVLLDTVGAVASDLEHEVVSMPAPLAGRYLVMAENGVAGRAVEHVLGGLLADPSVSADPFDELTGALAASAPGAGGVMFLPWLAGAMSPASEPAMTGGFLGVSLSTERADLLRATVEGTCRNLRWLLPPVEAFSGHATEAVVFGGGAARSAGWAQALADVLGRPVQVLERPEVAAARATGVAALRRHLGEDPLGAAVPTAAHHDPDPAAVTVHDAVQGQFEAAFAATRPICQALAR